jgi:hypothetical protein
MRIVHHEWQEQVGALLAAIFLHQRAAAQEQADFAGLTLEAYAALAVLEYLELNHADDLEIIRHDTN